ncbi:MAG: peptidoglycan editing factor PgeF [Ruminococcaceae bacterium]|nr:peptidoglycan editing factor PgeF [Oscillospiraceae bacterium]
MSFEVNRKGALEYLTSSKLCVPHCFSTRHGGVSTGDLSSLNLGANRGDDPENVKENYRRICAAIGAAPSSLVFARQTHSDIVLRVSAENRGEGLERTDYPVRDGLVTNSPGVTLVVFTADCAPVLLYDPVNRAIGAVHSGWRGTAQCITTRAVEAMQEHFGTDPADLLCAIGPAIGKCCFETHADVPEAMRAAMGETAEAAIFPKGEKFLVDNRELIRLQLLNTGVKPEHIDISTDCTACEPERFWSYRKVGNARGALAALISL